jgi:gliding motility-associated-like protein
VRKNLYRFLFLLTAVIPVCSQAQNYAGHNWYFGNSNQGIRFSRSDNAASLVTNQFTPFGTGGSAVASDPVTGNLVFYTDGTRVIDASHQAMPNGTIIGDNTRNQPVAICQNPANSAQYYIFHADAGGTVRYSVYDSTQIGNATAFGQPPLGDLVITSKNQTIAGLPANLSEGMIMIADTNGDDFWLMTHQTGTINYHFVKINATGVTYQGSVAIGLVQNVANLAYNASSKRIAVSPKEADRDVEILTIAFPVAPATLPTLTGTRVNNSAVSVATTQAIYDSEFSPNGQYLYVSVFGEGAAAGNVLQYDLTAPTLSPVSVLNTPPTESYGLQMGPDSTIYHLYQSGGSFLLGALTNTDTVASEVNYGTPAFAGNFGGRQFPQFAPRDSIKMKVYFEAQGFCANAPTSFFPTVTPNADSLNWDFGDGTTSSDWSPVYTYEAGGTYDVKLTAFLNGQEKDTTQTITINDFDTQITLVQDTTACSCELPYPKDKTVASCGRTFSVTAQIQGSGSATWQWFGPAGAMNSGSGTSATLTPDSAGYYYLVATVGGCSTYAGVNIKEYGIQDQRANIWYFGQNAGIDFNPLFDVPSSPAVPISNPVMDAPEGTSTISDRNGQVIFFTDGNKVWDRNFTEVATGIGGDVSATQSVLIIPVPGDETLYYIFTTQEIYGSYTYRLAYSLFDLKLNNGTGGLIEQNVTLFTKSTERITGNDTWLIAHEYGNNSFRAYQITATGIGNPVVSSIGSDHTMATAVAGQGYMKLGAQNRLAVALSTPGVSNIVEVFDFADSSGTVSNFRSVNLGSATGQVYGVEFGAGGNKLFATLKGATSKIYEFAFDTLGAPYEVDGPPAMSDQTHNEELGAIQIAPDGQLYVAVNNKPYLGVIQVNGDTTAASTFNVQGFALQPATPARTTTSRLGLPNFIQIISDPTQGPGISVAGQCLGDSTTFSGSGTDPIDEFFWQITQGGSVITSSTEESFSFLFQAAGLYTATLQITNRCGLDTVLTQQFRIYAPPADPSATLALCNPPLTLDANPTNAPDLSYLWETGDTTKTISVSRAGFYGITVTNNVSGCTTEGQIDVFPSLTTIDFGPDSTVCSAPTGGITLNTGINLQNHTWFINGVNQSNTGPTQQVSFATAGVFEYIAIYTDPNTSCTTRDTVVYTVNQSPVVNITSNGTIACGANNGQISIAITQPVGSPVSYTLGGPNFADTQSNIAVPFNGTVPNLEAGTYSIQVVDQVTGCFTNDATTISTTAFTVNNTSTTICDSAPISIGTSVAVTGTYKIFATSDPITPVETGNIVSNPQSSTGSYPPGDYQIEVTNTLNCVSGTTVTLTPGNAVTNASINTTNLCTTSQVTALGTGATTYAWTSTPANGISTDPSLATITVNPGTYDLQVILDDGAGNLCPTTVTQRVSVETVVPDFTFDGCNTPVILVASLTGNTNPPSSYFYRWSIDGGSPVSGQQLQLNGNIGQNYSVALTVQSPISGCTTTPAKVKNVLIAGPLSVTITTVNPPCDGSQFALLATPSRTVSSYQWSLNGTAISGGTTAQLNGQTTEGLYSVTVSDGQCEATADLDVLLAPTTPGNLTDTRMICPDDANPDPNTRVAVLDPGPDYESYEWFEVIAGSPSPLGVTTQTYTADRAGIFQVELENSFGCPSTDRTTVSVQCDPVIVGPNAFRPVSGMEQNKNFRLFTFFIDDEGFQVYIFNRWGEMVFASTDRQFEWNGGYNNNAGQMLPAGTYSYVVRYKSAYRPEDGTKEKRGGVLLVR